MTELHPALPFLFGAIVAVFAPLRFRQAAQLAVPVFSGWILWSMRLSGTSSVAWEMIPGVTLQLVRLDGLSFFFSAALILFTFLANIYALHVKEKHIAIAANLYAGSAVGAVLAGDLAVLFVFWEIMAAASAVLILNRARSKSSAAFFRYLLVHLTGGLFFFAGLLIKYFSEGSLAFTALPMDLAGSLIFTGFCVNAALVPFHAWLPDAYPEGTPAGSVYLCAFTTKVAVYAFARGFAGEECLVWLGAVSAVYGVIFALMENDMRRLLSYHIVCQIGYMLCGIGLGSELGVNAGAAHAAGNIFFKGLLFMSVGALIHRTGKYRLNELGGMAGRNGLILFFFLIGALAIAGFPFLNGYVSKVILLKTAAKAHMHWLELTLLLVAAGTFMSIALKLAYFAFWGEKKSFTGELAPVPLNMNIAMSGAALFCFAVGIFPGIFYPYLPYPADYKVFTQDHILHTLQLLAGTFLAFILILPRLHAKAVRPLDLDWFYIRGGRMFAAAVSAPVYALQSKIQEWATRGVNFANESLKKSIPPQTLSPVSWPLLLIVASALVAGILLLK